MVLPLVLAASLGACAVEEVDSRAVTLQQEPTVSGVAAPENVATKALALYSELATRLEARGVTPQDLQAAIDAGDEQAIREMFGFTPEEYEDAYRRLLALTADADPGEEPIGTQGVRCDGSWAPCFVGVAWGARQFAASGWLSLAIYAVSAASCAWMACRREDEPTPKRWKQP